MVEESCIAGLSDVGLSLMWKRLPVRVKSEQRVAGCKSVVGGVRSLVWQRESYQGRCWECVRA